MGNQKSEKQLSLDIQALVDKFNPNERGMYAKLVEYGRENRERLKPGQFYESLFKAGLTASRVSEIGMILKYDFIAKNLTRDEKPWSVQQAIDAARAKHKEEREEWRRIANEKGHTQSAVPSVESATKANHEEDLLDSPRARTARDEIVAVLNRLVRVMRSNKKSSFTCELYRFEWREEIAVTPS